MKEIKGATLLLVTAHWENECQHLLTQEGLIKGLTPISKRAHRLGTSLRLFLSNPTDDLKERLAAWCEAAMTVGLINNWEFQEEQEGEHA